MTLACGDDQVEADGTMAAAGDTTDKEVIEESRNEEDPLTRWVDMARTWNPDNDSFLEQKGEQTNFRAVKYDDGSKTKFSCNICNTDFASVQNVKRHIANKHMKNKTTPNAVRVPEEPNKRGRESPGHEDSEDKRLKGVSEKKEFDMNRVRKVLEKSSFVTSTQNADETDDEDM